MHRSDDSPSAWITRFAAGVAAGGSALDVACGQGRHARWLAARGLRVDAVDRDAAALSALAGVPGVQALVADLEDGPWPYAARQFDLIVVTRYLHRPLLPALLAALAPGGLLLYETFAEGQQRFGRPTNPAFLLQPGELLRASGPSLHVLAFEDGIDPGAPPVRIQRLAARRLVDPQADAFSLLRLP
jgi:SAM-dependent methyltransferase